MNAIASRVIWRQDLVSLVVQFSRFGLVGITNTGISAGVDAFLLFTGTPSPLAAGAAFAVATVNSYVLNRRWTFAAADSSRTRLAFAIVQLGGLGSTVVLVSAVDSMRLMDHFASYLAASVPVSLGMFLANRAWTFTERGKPTSSGPANAHSWNGPRRHVAGELSAQSSRHRLGHHVRGRHRRRITTPYYPQIHLLAHDRGSGCTVLAGR